MVAGSYVPPFSRLGKRLPSRLGHGFPRFAGMAAFCGIRKSTGAQTFPWIWKSYFYEIARRALVEAVVEF
jgi:hypothetical protein